MIKSIFALLLYMPLAFASHIQAQIRAGNVPARGVNLGGWLVAENWINPTDDLWNWDDPTGVQGTGEYFMMKSLGQ
ncbi:unnamed protein product, partial [Aphanomyces euteiches]